MAKRIDLYDAEHPDRKFAIRLIEEAIEPTLNREVNGVQYYALEDKLTLMVNERNKRGRQRKRRFQI